MTPTLHRAGWRHQQRHPWQAVLAVLGIALGVAVVFAVDLANQSARWAMAHSIERLAGRATDQLIGGPAGIDETFYPELRRALGLRAVAPVIEGLVRIEGETFHLLGLDPFAEGPFRAHVVGVAGSVLSALLTQPATVLIPAQTAARLGLAAGGPIAVEVGGVTQTLTVVAFAESPADAPAALDGLLVADIATAQEVFGRVGRLDRIDLILTDAERARLVAALPSGVTLQSAESRNRVLLELTRAFHTNLTALSLLALVVGGFLIYNTMTFSVLQRRPVLANLRLLGATRAEILQVVMLEALVLGVVGTLLGLAAGYLIAQGLLQLVTRTINDLYFVLTVTALQPGWLEWLKGLVLGLGATLLAALGPAFEAARTSPLAAQRRSALEAAAYAALPWLTGAGVALIGVGWLLARMPSPSLVLGFAALFLLIVGFSLLAPLGLAAFARLVTPLLGVLFGNLGRLGARGVVANLSRTGLAVAALAVAVSATVGVGVMITSFRASVTDWLDQTLQGDLYVSAPSPVSSRAAGTLDASVVERLRGTPGIAELGTGRRVAVESRTRPTELLAIAMARRSYEGFTFLGSDPTQVWPKYDAERAVLISEPLANHRRLGVGDGLELLTDRGWQVFEIAGVFRDYGSTDGMVVLRRALYEAFWDDPEISTVGIYLAPDADAASTRAAVVERLRPVGQAVQVRSNREIHALSLAIFDRTFAITHVLRLLVIGVAFVGVLSALLALQLEKAREYAVLRATGLTPRQLLGLVTLQTGLLGFAAGVLALPLGVTMAQVLIDVINLRAFGWSMQSLTPVSVLVEAVVLAVVAAWVAGLYPAWRIARVAPAQALRESL
ncbi:MAG: FtsX-like permease family protein [Thiotrichales bacterium]